MIRIIGIDASTVSTGVSVFKVTKNGAALEETFLLKSDNKNKGKLDKQKRTEITEQRVAFMIKGLMDIFKKYKPSVIVIEDVYGGKDMYTLKMLARFQGFVFGYAVLNDIKMEYKIASKWRKEVGIPLTDENKKPNKRATLKKLAVKKVKELYKIDVTDDVADAVLIGHSSAISQS